MPFRQEILIPRPEVARIGGAGRDVFAPDLESMEKLGMNHSLQ